MIESIGSDPYVGKTVAGRYTVIRRIGRGSMGSIYEVEHNKLKRTFAMKTLSGDFSEKPEALARFEREADVISRLRHPNIVDIVDWDVFPDGAPYLVMEYLRGEDLAKRIKGSPDGLSWPIVGRIADEVLAALSVAHKAKVVHRDLKPHNIFIASDDAGEERTKLLDFGVSKIRGGHTVTSADRRVIGTPAYMSPEQAQGRSDIGSEADVWAIGAILFEMAAGRRPFKAPTIPALMYKICHGSPDKLRDFRADAPEPFVDLIARTLSRDPTLRLRDVDRVRRELRDALAEVAPGAFATPMRSRPTAELQPEEVSAFDRTMPEGASDSVQSITTLGSSTGEAVESRTRPPKRRRGKLLAAAGVAAAAAVAIVLATGGDGNDEKPTPPTPATAPEQPTPEPEPEPEPPAPIRLRITSTPRGASVHRYNDDKLLGSTPYAEEVARERGMAVFVVRKKGYRDERVSLPTNQNGTATVALQRLAKAKPKPKGKVKPKSKPVTPPDADRRRGEPVDPFE